ncbi:MAG TPA: DNA mismatch repair endonuclease MutL [Ignavibacteria bacterium]|nr:DNA mismatch repair endonuclease MutL [Bacteroidota bacterium]HRE11223.1 DNA mismatch repair endonuclease MutL [Ignavibacteria bacterium]HRF64707.1 DNA mismatch repair endonuclease MutL [Ignavibacteria bacterium]HRJ03572.1 DNA mismatch repair endonuclease MutL [Ignavibacteria bacterium]
MPNQIKILPQFIANRIAAGEVVGRPEAVVKELIENSIDAGATSVQLIIRDAGKALIQVIDNGSGMNEDDAILSFQRHATSKISVADDLEHITTLGFRGEALASIAAVAQVELKTRRAEDELGTQIKNHGNEIVEHTKVQTEKGTSIAVRNLFYNTPARRNFLKTNQTEFRHIYDTFTRLAIANFGRAFSFINEDEEMFDMPAQSLHERLTSIFGREAGENLLEVEHSNELLSLKGYISKPSFTKKNKQDQNLYLNNRYVVSKALSFAVHSAYEDLVDKGDYPNFFLFLTLDPAKFDINVHPSKLEVKFEEERALFSFIRRGVWSTLEKNDLIVKVKIPETTGFDISQNKTAYSANIFKSSNFTGKVPQAGGFTFKKHDGLTNEPTVIHEMFGKNSNSAFEFTDEGIPEQEKTPLEEKLYKEPDTDSLVSKNEIWQFQRKYIMYQLESTLMIIDQHAAHERILYEQAIERLNSNANLTQQLLIPIYTELNPVDYEVAKAIEAELGSLGFEIELQSKRKVKIKGIPSDVRIGDEGKILQELIDQYKEYDIKLNLEKRDNLAKSYACKHAIKAGDHLTEGEMLNLIDKLFSVKMPYVCPHGRPTIVKLSMDELDKMFYRTGI